MPFYDPVPSFMHKQSHLLLTPFLIRQVNLIPIQNQNQMAYSQVLLPILPNQIQYIYIILYIVCKFLSKGLQKLRFITPIILIELFIKFGTVVINASQLKFFNIL